MRILFYSLLFFIPYQHVFVLKLVGNIKFVELISIVLTILVLVHKSLVVKKKYISVLLFITFVFFPIFSFIITNINSDAYLSYKDIYNSQTSIRFTPTVSFLIGYIYLLVTYIIINSISNNYFIKYYNLNFYNLGLLVACIYSFYGVIFIYGFGLPDIVPSAIDSRNTLPNENFRISGFSSEPGTFIYFLGVGTFYSIFEKKYKTALFFFFTSFFTLSTQIVPLIFSLFIYLYIICNKTQKYLIFILLLFIIALSYNFIDSYPVVKYIVIEKVYNYIFVNDHTLDSGSFRNFTTRIGFNIGFDYLSGVGVGQSYFYMHQYQNQMGILNWGEVLSFDSMPQNFYSMLFSEASFFGVISYSLLLFYSLINVYKKMKSYFSLYLTLCLFVILCFMSLTPYYSIVFILPIVILYGAIKSRCRVVD